MPFAAIVSNGWKADNSLNVAVFLNKVERVGAVTVNRFAADASGFKHELDAVLSGEGHHPWRVMLVNLREHLRWGSLSTYSFKSPSPHRIFNLRPRSMPIDLYMPGGRTFVRHPRVVSFAIGEGGQQIDGNNAAKYDDEQSRGFHPT